MQRDVCSFRDDDGAGFGEAERSGYLHGAPNGPYAHVYVTASDVKAHVNANAGDNDAGFVDLTPGLSTKPQQIDLLGQARNQCFLASLGSTQELQPGKYQQIRVILTDNSPGRVG
jgi:hypothetical protein